MTTCAQCGFTYGLLARAALPGSMRAQGRTVAQRVESGSDDLGTRRLAEEWSPLEYACHVRDVLVMQRDRLYVALVEDEPSFTPMYREERVAHHTVHEMTHHLADIDRILGSR
jgi:DNA segregation ATPase FtsK/SpoIIIE, S-DNA-T family